MSTVPSIAWMPQVTERIPLLLIRTRNNILTKVVS